MAWGFHVGEGRPAEAWRDLQACHRLARHAGRNATLVVQLVAMAIDGVTCAGTQRLLHHAEPSESLAQQILDDLRELPPCSDIAYAIDQGERHFYLDSVVLMATGRASAGSLIGATGGPTVDEILTRIQLNWNLVLRTGNVWYDRIVAAAELSVRNDREQAFDTIDADLTQLSMRMQTPMAWLGGIVSRNQRSRLVANMLLSMFLPALQAASNAQDRNITTTDMTRIAAALAVYRAQHGDYPEQLSALQPEILTELPLDLYSGSPFIYQRKSDGGFLLYSVFENGVDDRATDYSGEIIEGEWIEQIPDEFEYGTGEHDLVIRMPVPEFKMPEPPQADESGYY